jgi:hypothetical protein
MGRDPVYEDLTGRPASPEAIALRRWIHARYLSDPDEALPGRFRYYQAISAEIISKHAVQDVIGGEGVQTVTAGDRLWKAALMWVREHELVPDAWIVDRTRQFYDYTGYRTIVAGVLALLDQIPLDAWRGRWPLLFVESEASAAVIAPVARAYRVQMAVGRGQAGRAYLHNVVAPELSPDQVVLAVVDLDKVGGDIAASARERLEKRIGAALDWRLLALTEAQVEAYGITMIPRVDGRETRNPQTRMVAETEALGAETIRTIVREALEALLPTPLVTVLGRERRQRRQVRRQLTRED